MTPIRKDNNLRYALERAVVGCLSPFLEPPSDLASTVLAGPGFILAITPTAQGQEQRWHEARRRICRLTNKQHSANVSWRA